MRALRQEQLTFGYEFGPYLVDPGKYILSREGVTVPLSLKAFEILLLLIEKRGQVVEKDEILRRVWPDTVVEENNLARHISALRKALDEQPNEHQYILTVPGRGYRFIAGVRELEDVVDKPIDPPLVVPSNPTTNGYPKEVIALPKPTPPLTPASRFSLRFILPVLGISIAGVAAILFFVSVFRQTAPAPKTQRKLWQLTFDPGLESEPAWSPDGRMIAYSSDRGGNFDLYVQPVGEGDPVRVTNSAAHDWQPDWAPEGNRLVFRSERDGGGLFIIPILGGSERKISSFGYRPHWSRDGTQILFTSTLVAVSEIPKVYIVGLDGKPPQEVLTNFLPQFRAVRVAWGPDGNRLSVWGNHETAGWSFWTVPIDGKPAVKSELNASVQQQLKDADVEFVAFQWSPTRNAIYFEGVTRKVRNLWKVSVDPQSLEWIDGPERLTTGVGLDTNLSVSQDGKRLAYTARMEQTRIWSMPFDERRGRIKGPGQPVTAAGISSGFPDLSPDGQRLVYIAVRGEKEELWEKSLKDGRETLLIAGDDFLRGGPRWSPDGSSLTYYRDRAPTTDRAHPDRTLVLLSTSGGKDGKDAAGERTITGLGTRNETPWDWSADGKWILAGTDRQTHERMLLGLFPIAAQPHAESQMQVVTAHPGQNIYQARFSPDHQWISFLAAKAMEAGSSTIYVIPAAGGEWRRITEGKFFDDKPRWSPDGRRIYFISNRTGFFNVWCIAFDPASGQAIDEPYRVTSFESPTRMILPYVKVMEMALSHDRLILPIMEVSGEIWILESVDH
jgi:Tol biopolymer transport system component/DNA-binding winged helix-turn-helix (wHTH) protein